MTLGEMANISSMISWKLSGKDRLVKVVSPWAEKQIIARGTTGGYVTQEKYLYGLTSTQIERVLGLRPGELHTRAIIYGLSRMPSTDEVDFKFSAAFPDGAPFSQSHVKNAMQARTDYAAGKNLYDHSGEPVTQYYQQGSGMIPQWKIKTGVRIAVSGVIAHVTQVLAFPRSNGSLKPFTPYNRKPIS